MLMTSGNFQKGNFTNLHDYVSESDTFLIHFSIIENRSPRFFFLCVCV